MKSPTWQFIHENLRDGEDIEILSLKRNADGTLAETGHYVTLTGLTWIDADGDLQIDQDENAMLAFVDPAGGPLEPGTGPRGAFKQRALFQQVKDGPLIWRGRTGLEFEIVTIVKESPAEDLPAPGTGVLLGTGLAALGVWRRRRSSTRHASISR